MSMMVVGAGAWRRGSGGGGGNFPQIAGVTPTAVGSNASTINVNRPAVDTGDLLVYVFANDGQSRTVTPPTGITKIAEEIFSSANGRIFYEIAGAASGPTTVAFSISQAEEAACLVVKYLAGTFSGIPECTSTTSTGPNPDPPAISPSGGSADYSVIAAFAADNNGAVSVYPFSSNQNFVQSSGNTNANCSIAMCTGNLSGGSFNPGAFTKTGNFAWGAFTVSVKGA